MGARLAWQGRGACHDVQARNRFCDFLRLPHRDRADCPGVRGRIVQEAESGVDFTHLPWRPEHPKSRSDLVSFVFCSRFVDWKGITYLVRAFAPLAREGSARLDLIGDGELFDDIRDQIRREGLERQIILHGRVSVESYAALLDKSL